MIDLFSKIKRITPSNLLEFSIWGIVFCLPFSKSLVEIFIIAAIVLTVFIKIKKRDFTFRKSPLTFALILYFGINFLSIFWSVDFLLSLRSVISKIAEYIILFYIVYDFVDSEKKLKRLLLVVLVSVILITANGFIQQYITRFDILRGYPSFKTITTPGAKYASFKGLAFKLPPEERGYITSSFPFPNDYATWIITLLPLALAASFFDLKKMKKSIRIWSYAAFLALVFSLFLTKTRGAWIACSIGVLILSMIRSKKLIIGFILATIFFYIIMPGYVRKAVKSRLSFKDRVSTWSISLEMIKKRPVLGSGLNTYFGNYKIYRNDKDKFKRGSYAHNCYLQQAVDIGIVGLLIFLYLLFSIFWLSIKKIIKIKDDFYSSCALGLWVGLLCFAIYAFVDTNFYSLPLVVLFWFMTGLLFSIINIYEHKCINVSL